MSGHPENSPEVNKLMEELAKNSKTSKVWCKGCNDWSIMNASYSKYVRELDSCRKCRKA